MRRQPNPQIRPEDALTAWDAAVPVAGLAPVTAHCTLVTPMYGGGVKPGEVDREMPIRPSTVRGQLRFWWRLRYGGGRPSRAVFRDESELWGGISGDKPQASRVALQVRAAPIESSQLIKSRERRDFPAYSLILDKDDVPDVLAPGYEFDLTLRFDRQTKPAQRTQVVEALRWWASFGGVGARTRRGLGAVAVTSDVADVKPVSREEVAERGGELSLQPRAEPITAWKRAVEALRDFRQGPGVGRNPGSRPNRPGRSRWPESDAIRRLTGQWTPRHEPRHPVEDLYPRAAFGLPMVFHFKDRDDPKGPNDKGPTLVPKAPEGSSAKDPDRMASPLILRPYFDGAGYCPLALLLPGWRDRVSISVGFDPQSMPSAGQQDSRKSEWPAFPAWPPEPGERQEKAEQIEPLREWGRDVLSAFMHYFEHGSQRAHRERTRGDRTRPQRGRR
ncbi:MAG: type III-B CRISPR module RAMP protein Cmr1 [Acidobacteria bacterium]|nr:type III-B CRISPR module RAMP protein Cmr1 [Acidobacteriota bacterium]